MLASSALGSALAPNVRPRLSPFDGEPTLAAMRSALLHRPYAMLRATAFGTCLAVSLILLAHRAHLIAPSNQYAVDAGTAIAGLTARARAEAGVAARSAGDAAQAAWRRALAAVSVTRAPVTPVAAPAALARPRAGAKRPILAANGTTVRSLRGRRRDAAKTAGARRKPRGALGASSLTQGPHQTSKFDGVVNWSLYEFPERLRDECAKAYYGVLDFLASELELSEAQLRFRVQGWTDRLLAWFEASRADGNFSAANPAAMFRGPSALHVAMAAASAILMILMIAGVVAAVRQ